jgi:hypothetical protein
MEDGPSPYLPEQHYQMGVNIAGEATYNRCPFLMKWNSRKKSSSHTHEHVPGNSRLMYL